MADINKTIRIQERATTRVRIIVVPEPYTCHTPIRCEDRSEDRTYLFHVLTVFRNDLDERTDTFQFLFDRSR